MASDLDASIFGKPLRFWIAKRTGRYSENDEAKPLPSISPNLRDRIFLFAVVAMGYCQYLLPGSDVNAGTGSPFANGLWAIGYCIAFIGIAAERRTAIRLLRASMPLVALLALAVLSTVWSPEPVLTARRSIELVGTSAFGLYFVCRLGFRGLIETFGATIAILGCISVVLIVFFPGLGASEEYDGAWQGVFNHKNALGPAMLLGVISIASILPNSRGIRRGVELVALVLCTVLMIGSRNAGGYASALLLSTLVPTLLWSRANRRGKAVVFALAGVIAAFVAGTLAISILGIDLNDALGAFGKDSTFTGRAEVWQLVINAISQRPVLGYGYGIFWGEDGPAASLVYPGITNHWEPQSAHNGFLEVAINIGLAGELALLLAVGVGLWRAIAAFWQAHDSASLWPFCVLVCVIAGNLSEATFATYNLVDWVVLVSAFLLATQSRLERPSSLSQPLTMPAIKPIL